MLEKKYRISKNKDFKNVFDGGVFVKGDFISIKVKKIDSPDKIQHTRIGFVVGKSVTKKAVLRNKIKRQLRSAVYGCIEEIKEGLDIVMMPAADITEKSFNEINKEVKKILKKAHII